MTGVLLVILAVLLAGLAVRPAGAPRRSADRAGMVCRTAGHRVGGRRRAARRATGRRSADRADGPRRSGGPRSGGRRTTPGQGRSRTSVARTRPWSRMASGWGDRRARHAVEAAVPEVLDVLRAAVAAGAGPLQAVQAAAETAPPVLADALAEAARAAAVGITAGRALADAGARSGSPELVTAGEALELATATGAPLGPVLAGVAAAATDRLRARQALLAATAQARLSARVVAAMAPAFLLVLAATAPRDAAFLVSHPVGWATVAAAGVFEALGMWWSAHILRGRP